MDLEGARRRGREGVGVVPSSQPVEKLHLWESVQRVSSLRAVAEAVAVAIRTAPLIYVERWATGWRWSLAHCGGPYPLLRITAVFLEIPYQEVVLGYDTTPDGCSYVRASERTRAGGSPQGWGLLAFEQPVAAREARARILGAELRRRELGPSRTS